MSVVTTHGVRLYYKVQGQGEPVMVVTGPGTDSSDFIRITGPLSQRYKVLVFDNRGSGKSDKPDEPYSIGLMAADAANVMRGAGWRRASIIGISLGSRTALELASQHPAMVSKLVLVSSSGARAQHGRCRALPTSAALQLLFFNSEHPQPPYAFKRQWQASGYYDSSKQLRELQTPTLIMHGLRDRVAPLSLAQEMQYRIKDATLLGFRGGHLFFLIGQRRQFLTALEAFLG